jgi:ECF sigma factor
MSHVTQVLDRIEKGDGSASKELLPLVYEQLRHLAAYKMAQEAPGNTLQPTALVHEAWLRLGGDEKQLWNSRIISSWRQPRPCDASSSSAHDKNRGLNAAADSSAFRLRSWK